jgi:hypothetical protein
MFMPEACCLGRRDMLYLTSPFYADLSLSHHTTRLRRLCGVNKIPYAANAAKPQPRTDE